MLHDVDAECAIHEEMAEFLGYASARGYLRAQDRDGIRKRMAKALGI
jgi:hypothetical protein